MSGGLGTGGDGSRRVHVGVDGEREGGKEGGKERKRRRERERALSVLPDSVFLYFGFCGRGKISHHEAARMVNK